MLVSEMNGIRPVDALGGRTAMICIPGGRVYGSAILYIIL